jgi:uncharacterized protein YbjT (DUF2867 family)
MALHNPNPSNVVPFHWDFPKVGEFPAFGPEDPFPRIVLHLAYETTTQHLKVGNGAYSGLRPAGLEGTLAFSQLAHQAGADHQIFLSSCSAHGEAESQYGRTKYALEKLFTTSRDWIVRPALVLGNGGVFARMVKTARSSPILPLFDNGAQPVQVVPVEFLVEQLFAGAQEGRTGRDTFAAPGFLSMREYFQLLAPGKPLLPIPSAAVLPLVKLVESLGFTPPINSENLLGLRSLRMQAPLHPSTKTLPVAGECVKKALQELNA